MKYALLGARVFTGEIFLDNHAVIIEADSIHSVVEIHELDPSLPKEVLQGGVLAPGFIDVQVNGGGGVLFNNAPSTESITAMVNAHRTKGTTSLLPTLISDTQEIHSMGVNAIHQSIAEGNKSVLGVHIEGPFFSEAKRGAHNEAFIRALTQTDVDWLIQLKNTQDVAMVLTLAPERTSVGHIRQLTQAGIAVCAGHTDAHYDEIKNALDEGLRGFTHLYNAMRPTSGREPGVVGAALDDKHSWCGIIIDSHHVHAASARIAYAAKPQNIFLVSDSMSTIGSHEKSFSLYGEMISEKNGCLVNAEGRLAGSAIGLMDAVRLNTQWVGESLDESLRRAALYPAQFMQVDNYLGKIRAGFRADLVHFSEDFSVQATWVAGDKVVHA